MCGIAGIWNLAGADTKSGASLRMQTCLAHRGPDAAGIAHVQGAEFVHTRLSIIDLSDAGNQPYRSEDGRYVLVFNGEIYNYKELKEQYGAGQEFRSDSDTEVLLHLLIAKGTDALDELRGMFSFVFFDTQEKRMILSRDAFGKKPLFYSWVGDTFLFASEPKAILESGYLNAKLDTNIVAPYLFHEYCPAPYSGFEGIYVLGAGQYMDITPSLRRIVQWYTPSVTPKHTLSFSSALSTLDELLGTAVERRMVADVPVGLFLSGGLDSSTIGWYMRNLHKDADIHSCSVSFEDATFNEEPIASQVATSLQLTHHSVLFTKDIFLQTVREIVPFLDVPLADASLLPTYVVSKLARSYMKVVLDGDGSDELLGGYGTFSAYELSQMLSWIPRPVWETFSTIAENTIPVSHRYFSTDFKIKSFLRGMGYPSERTMQAWLGSFTKEEIDMLLTAEYSSSRVFDAADSFVSPAIATPFDRASMYHIKGYLTSDILVKIDRATMMVGLEARTPFLDVDVTDFLLRLPPSYRKNKRILRELMKGRLPDVVLERKKQGFGIPISSWFAGELHSFVEEVLSNEAITDAGIFRYEYVRQLIDEHTSKKRDHRKKLWTLMVFQMWYEYWILKKRPE